MKLQKGQGLVEFALILPFLMLVIFGLMYLGLMFSDYIALNNIAREAARKATVVTTETYRSDPEFNNIKNTFSSQDLPNGMYSFNSSDINIEADTDSNSQYRVTVTVTANAANDSLLTVFNNIMGGNRLTQMTVTYSMYSENELTLEED